jgi:restriction endonuclease S subunit
MAFQLSPQADPNKVFLVNLSETEGRLDPNLYKKSTKDLFNSIRNSKYPKKELKNLIIHSASGNWGYDELADLPSDKFSKALCIRATEFDNDFNLNLDGSRIKFRKHSIEKLKSLDVQLNDILIEKSGGSTDQPVGRAAIITEDILENYSVSFSNFIYKLRIDPSVCLPEYLFCYLKTMHNIKVTEALQSQTNGIRNLIMPQFLRLDILLPKFEIQRDIVSKFRHGQNFKQNAEAEAKRLLLAIDEYILQELGITLPEADNSLENRVFYANFSEVSGGRFDPKLYDNNTKALFRAVENGKYRKVSLRSLINHSVAGSWGFDEILPLPEEEYTKTLCIRATEFDNLFNLNLDGSRVKYRQIGNTKLKSMDIKPNDLLIEKSGGSPDQPVGRISILTDEILEEHTVSFSNFIHKIRIDPSVCLPEYLFCYLKTMHNIKVTEAMQSQTNGIRNLIMREYFGQTILLPDLDKQKEIAATAQAMRQKAQDLMQQGKAQLEATKKEVERMILNSDAPSV